MNWLATTKPQHQFAVEASLVSGGIDAYVFRKVEIKRRGKSRTWQAEINPLWQNYIFINATPQQFHQAQTVRHLHRTLEPIVPAQGKKLAVLRRRNQDDVDSAFKAADMGNGPLSCYNSDQLLEILDGPFKGSQIKFREMRDSLTSMFPKIVGALDLMGQQTIIEIDPLSVRAAT